MLPNRVLIKEVGPRDGLQNEAKHVPTHQKVKLIEMLQLSGLSYIEATSFVHPKWIPQLADASDVLSQVDYSKSEISALAPNIKGLERAKSSGLNEIAVFISASEKHNEKNLNRTIEQSLNDIKEVINERGELKVRAYISMVFGSPFGDVIPLETVTNLMKALYDLGVYEISLGDTTGMANPKQVDDYLTIIKQQFDVDKIAMHFHDTNNLALANIYVSLTHGVHIFDASVGGLGGCPYAKGAAGNVATEDVVFLMQSLNIETGIDFKQLIETADYIAESLKLEEISTQLKLYRKGN